MKMTVKGTIVIDDGGVAIHFKYNHATEYTWDQENNKINAALVAKAPNDRILKLIDEGTITQEFVEATGDLVSLPSIDELGWARCNMLRAIDHNGTCTGRIVVNIVKENSSIETEFQITQPEDFIRAWVLIEKMIPKSSMDLYVESTPPALTFTN